MPVRPTRVLVGALVAAAVAFVAFPVAQAGAYTSLSAGIEVAATGEVAFEAPAGFSNAEVLNVVDADGAVVAQVVVADHELALELDETGAYTLERTGSDVWSLVSALPTRGGLPRLTVVGVADAGQLNLGSFVGVGTKAGTVETSAEALASLAEAGATVTVEDRDEDTGALRAALTFQGVAAAEQDAAAVEKTAEAANAEAASGQEIEADEVTAADAADADADVSDAQEVVASGGAGVTVSLVLDPTAAFAEASLGEETAAAVAAAAETGAHVLVDTGTNAAGVPVTCTLGGALLELGDDVAVAALTENHVAWPAVEAVEAGVTFVLDGSPIYLVGTADQVEAALAAGQAALADAQTATAAAQAAAQAAEIDPVRVTIAFFAGVLVVAGSAVAFALRRRRRAREEAEMLAAEANEAFLARAAAGTARDLRETLEERVARRAGLARYASGACVPDDVAASEILGRRGARPMGGPRG